MRIFTIICVIISISLLFAASSTRDSNKPNPNLGIETVWGPDAYGYIARDSNEPNGPPVEWIDISGIGTPVPGLGDDNIVGPFNVGFPFHYYWYDVTSFHVGSNGYLRFSGTGQLSSPFTTIPSPVAPNDIVCFYTADFDPGSGGNVYYWSNNTDTLIVSFVGVPAWNTPTPTGSFDFQVVLSMVDTSITFNYGTLTGPFYNTNGMVGIENNAGDIGIYNYPTNVVSSNYSIKFYYPAATTFQVDDVGVPRVQNENSGGFFLELGQDFQANATIKNFGNQNEGNFDAIAEVRQYPSNVIIFSDSVHVDTLETGQTMEITFPEVWTMDQLSDFYLRVRTNLAGDLVASNDQKDVELHSVLLPGELYLDDNVNENNWSWAGGTGGMSVKYFPPSYPVKVTEIRAHLGGSFTLPVLLQLYDDDGPNGEPGTLLTSVQYQAGAAGWHAVNIADSGIVINDGAVYAAWIMTGTGSPGIDLDENSQASRQTWEYTGVWANWRNAEISDAMIRISVESVGQVVLSDDFEGGLGNWTGDWALTTEASHSPSNSYTDSPGGPYPNNANLIGAMASGVDLSSFLGATLEFYTKYELETGFDYCYLEASTDGGTNWINLETYNGEGVVTQFELQSVDIGAFAGASDFRIRFRLVSDGGYVTDGMYVDDLTIVGSTEDTSPPLLQFDPPQFYLGVPDTFHFPVKITDLSGVATAELTYTVDGGTGTTISATTVSNDTFYFDIPTVEHGALVEFYIFAEDGASSPNSTTSDTMAYISGSHQVFDDGDPEFIVGIGPGVKVATRFDMPAGATPQVTTGLLKIYTDINNPIDTVTFHIWADNGGVPGADIVTPFKFLPAATLAHPQAFTIIDLRAFAIEPTGDFWIGWENTSTLTINYLYDTPPVYNRSYTNTGSAWTLFAGDYHTRAVLGSPPTGIEVPGEDLVPTKFALQQNYPNPFNPSTTIRYQIPRSSQVRLVIYNLLGQKIRTLINEQKELGYFQAIWNGQNDNGIQVGSGIYFYRFQAGDFLSIKKMMYLK